MTDQCKHCTLRGDIDGCKSTECFQHESWYAQQQQLTIDDQAVRMITVQVKLQSLIFGELSEHPDKPEAYL